MGNPILIMKNEQGITFCPARPCQCPLLARCARNMELSKNCGMTEYFRCLPKRKTTKARGYECEAFVEIKKG